MKLSKNEMKNVFGGSQVEYCVAWTNCGPNSRIQCFCAGPGSICISGLITVNCFCGDGTSSGETCFNGNA